MTSMLLGQFKLAMAPHRTCRRSRRDPGKQSEDEPESLADEEADLFHVHRDLQRVIAASAKGVTGVTAVAAISLREPYWTWVQTPGPAGVMPLVGIVTVLASKVTPAVWARARPLRVDAVLIVIVVPEMTDP